jgi:hypothetical protein
MEITNTIKVSDAAGTLNKTHDPSFTVGKQVFYESENNELKGTRLYDDFKVRRRKLNKIYLKVYYQA